MYESEESETLSKIKVLLDIPELTNWERTFLKSISEVLAYKPLSVAQAQSFARIEQKYSHEAAEASRLWNAAYDAEKKRKFDLAVQMYSKTNYFTDVVKKAKEDPNYIPSELTYKKVVDNRYAKGYIANADAPPKFQKGDLVVLKEFGLSKLSTVIESLDEFGWQKNSRVYNLFVIGEGVILRAVEDQIRNVKEKNAAHIWIGDKE